MISLLLASLLGCTAAVVHIQPMDPVPDAHWIQLDDDGKAWDCVSRPDGKNWDGLEYYDPLTKKGVVYLFKPGEVTDTITIKLRGVESGTRYRVTFEDGSNHRQMPCSVAG